MGRPRGWASEVTGRPVLRSPGRPPAGRREHRVLFWAAIARGAARDSINLKRMAALQLANMIALDPANVVFAAMEFALLRSRSVKNYLSNR